METPTPYQIGETHPVPCAIMKPHLPFLGLMEVPILGPRHEDAAIIGFAFQHYHIDWRFVDDETLARLWSYEKPGDEPLHVLLLKPERVEMRSLTVQRQFSAFPTAKYLPALEAQYAEARLGSSRICPHKGADLALIAPVDGVVTCPLHGLRWCHTTGKLLPRSTPSPANPIPS